MSWSLKHIEQLKAAGKIRDYSTAKVSNSTGVPRKRVTKHFCKRSKEKDFISRNLSDWCNEKGYKLQEEFRFKPDRKWRSDWAIPKLMILVEYEGGIFQANGDHRSRKGVQRDINKYNSAQALGYRVIRFTAINYQEIITELNKFL